MIVKDFIIEESQNNIMLCKKLGIELCIRCSGDEKSSCSVINHKILFEKYGVRTRIIHWVKYKYSKHLGTYFFAALKHFYPEHVETYEKLLVLL